MSHHSSGPDWRFPHGDARLDLTDRYAFPRPGNAGTSRMSNLRSGEGGSQFSLLELASGVSASKIASKTTAAYSTALQQRRT
jgi:hypothetical protein